MQAAEALPTHGLLEDAAPDPDGHVSEAMRSRKVQLRRLVARSQLRVRQ